MFHRALTASVLFCVVACFALVGCREASRSSQRPQMRSVDRAADSASHEENTPQTYVNCQATLTDYDEDHQWFDNSEFGHDDGVSPLASFELTEPPVYVGQMIGIVFKYTADDATIPPPNQKDVGGHFTFQIPEAALKGQYTTIDNLSVKNLRSIKPLKR